MKKVNRNVPKKILTAKCRTFQIGLDTSLDRWIPRWIACLEWLCLVSPFALSHLVFHMNEFHMSQNNAKSVCVSFDGRSVGKPCQTFTDRILVTL